MVGAPYIVDSHTVRNQFLARIVNKKTEPRRFVVSLEQGPPELTTIGFSGIVVVAPLGELVEPLILQMPRPKYVGPFQVWISVGDEAGTFHLRRSVEFLGPDPRLLREEEEENARQGKSK